jgi:hypothetical protein
LPVLGTRFSVLSSQFSEKSKNAQPLACKFGAFLHMLVLQLRTGN